MSTRGAGTLERSRFAAQMLSGRPARHPDDVAERLLAIQAQDLRGAQLAVRARTKGMSVTDIDRALTNDRSVLISWLNRGTLHLVRSDDYGLLQALTTPQLFTGNARRLGQEGVTPRAAERGVVTIVRAIESDGPQTRLQLGERLREANVPIEGQALVHILMLASLRGLIVRGPMAGTRHAFVLVRDWLGARPPPPDRDAALVELARRYLAGHGPASERDLAWWAGIPLRDARTGLKGMGPQLIERRDGLVQTRRRSVDELPPPRLLGPWEPLIVGWRDRDWVLGPGQPRIVIGGLFRHFALVRGRAVATWSMPGGTPVTKPFARIARGDSTALERDAADVVRFLSRKRSPVAPDLPEL